MKFWYQSAVNFDAHPGYAGALKKHFKTVGSPGTEVELHGTRPEFSRGLIIGDTVGSPYAYHMTVVPMFLDSLIQAEKQGCDAFIVATFSEPVLREMRSVARIPVVSSSEATMLTACTVAPKIGLVTLNSIAEGYIKKSVAFHKLESRITGIYVVDEDMTEGELDRNFDTPAPYIERFKQTARLAIADGAEAIIAAEGLVAAMMSVNGVRELDGAQIIDVVGTAVLFAEFAVNLHKRTGLEPARRSFYTAPSAAARKALLG